MADLEFLDSCGHYDTATLYQKYENPGGCTVVPGVGRGGVQAIEVGLFGSGPQITFKSNPTTVIVGAAMKVGTHGDGRPLLSLLNNGISYCRIEVREDARVVVKTGTQQSTSFLTMDLDTFYYIEIKGVIDAGAGTLTVEGRVNEVVIGTAQVSGAEYTALITQGAYFTQFQSFAISPGVGIANDFYCTKSSTYIGDIKVRFIKPNAPGFDNDWSIFGAATAWQATNQVPPDGDTSYIFDHTPLSISPPVFGDKTSVNMEDVDLEGGTCPGIQFLANARKDNANVRAITPYVINGGLATNGDELSLPANYVYTHDCQDVNPNTGLPYTEAELDAIQLGVFLTR